MAFMLALLPILIILTLMMGFHWSAARAGAAGYLCGLIVAVFFFGASPLLLAYAHAKALLFSLDVLLIIWAAFLLYRVSDEAGAIQTIGRALPGLTPDRGLQALIIGWVFASFLQGVGGFGVPVAVTAPLLVGIGLPPLASVVAPSLGHGWAVTFGSMGSSFQALMATTGLSEAQLGPPAAVFLGIACPLSGLLIAHSIGGRRELRRLAAPALIWGAVMGVIQWLVVRLGGWNIAAFLGGLAGLMITPLVIRTAGRSSNTHSDPAGEEPASSSTGAVRVSDLLIALSAYAILILLILVIQLVPAVKSVFGRVVLQFQFPEITSAPGPFYPEGFVTPAGLSRKLNLFGHTGAILAYASFLSYWVYRRTGRYQSGAGRRIAVGTLKRVLPSSVSILSMIAMALIMEHAGMTAALAQALASGVGPLFPVVSPWIGAIGALMTGSNTNSNVVFGALQMHTAELLRVPVVIILAAQTAGAALGSVAAPAKVVVGASTAGMAGKEGEVMRKLAVYTVILIGLISLLTVIAVSLFS